MLERGTSKTRVGDTDADVSETVQATNTQGVPRHKIENTDAGNLTAVVSKLLQPTETEDASESA